MVQSQRNRKDREKNPEFFVSPVGWARNFVRDSYHLVNKCTKPDAKGNFLKTFKL